MSNSPAPRFSDPEEYRALNRRMAESILEATPAPYVEGGYVRRVVEIRGRRTGTVHLVPIAVVTRAGRHYLVSPTRDRNWVKNLLADPAYVVVSRDSRVPGRARHVEDPEEAADVVLTYLATMDAPWAVAQFPFARGASRAEVVRVADRLAVFELA